MEFRAQCAGRCQRQNRAAHNGRDPEKTDLLNWISEWTQRIDQDFPFHRDGLRPVVVQVDWRLITNSGVDEGVIRPVIGAGGWPMIPGSGIKGLFRRACSQQQAEDWCGSAWGDQAVDPMPGTLRFHGAWPLDNGWTRGLLDVAHPQQHWQLGFQGGGESHSANGVVSMLQPRLCIALSSTKPDMSMQEWGEIEQTLKIALGNGIGGRTCVGYGRCGNGSGTALFECAIAGQGQTAKLLDGTPEFRPTMFRAAIRGMALRLFGGLCNDLTAHKVVGRLFGTIDGNVVAGLLGMNYTDTSPDRGSHPYRNFTQPTYATSGQLIWRQMRKFSNEENKELLIELLAGLHGLTMTLGGFGNSWRRPDHRVFHPQYYQGKQSKPLIGCHWQWQNVNELPQWIHVQSADELSDLLRRSCDVARRWLLATGETTGQRAGWREVIHPDAMMIWIRTASNAEDARAVHWLHQELKGTALGGQMGRVGRIWNRMLPLVDGSVAVSGGGASRQTNPLARPANPMARPSSNLRPVIYRGNVSIAVHPGKYLETVVLFPVSTQSRDFTVQQDFIAHMNNGRGADAGFERVRFNP